MRRENFCVLALACAFGCDGTVGEPLPGTGGTPASSGGTGGTATSTGGAVGQPSGGTGGTPTSGGISSTGGTTGGLATGGTTANGGITGGVSNGGTTGGSKSGSSGGVSNGGTATGGMSGKGGAAGTSTGGNAGAGASGGRGGSAATGGAGGKVGSGGAATGGAATGGSGGGGTCVPNLACKLTAPASTGDIHQDCVNRINQFLTQCACLPALTRRTDAEACANQMAEYDAGKNSAHAGARDNICSPNGSQNECPGYASNNQVISLCIQQMWDEGPPPTSSCTGACYEEHGHYINMTEKGITKVACGFFTTSSGKVWSVQNFFR
jgi:hypothetical protein